MHVTLYHRGMAIGESTLGPLTDGRRHGTLSPSEHYDAARPALQRITVDAAAKSRTGEDMSGELMAGHAALADEGLEIRNSAGAVIPNRFIFVGDYSPQGTDMRWFSQFVPLQIIVQFS